MKVILLLGLIFLLGCVDGGKIIYLEETLDTNSLDQNTIIEIAIWKSPSASLTMVDVGSDRNEFPGFAPTTSSGSDRFVLDLNRVSQYRFISWIQNTPATTASLILQHSDNNITFYDSNIGNEVRCCIDLNGGIGLKVGPWIDINQETANPRTYFRVMHVGGNGISDTQFRSIAVQFKVPVATHATITSGGSSTDTNCSNNSSCIITGRINSGFDANVLDLNSFGDSNFVNNTTLIPPLTANNQSSTGAGNPVMANFMQGGLTKIQFTSVFGTAPVIAFQNSIIAAIGYIDLSGFMSLGATGIASSFTDDIQFDITAPTTNLSNTTLTNTGTIFQNNANFYQTAQSLFAADVNIDANFYARRVGDINQLRVNRLISNLIPDANKTLNLGDGNRYYSTTFTNEIFVDGNIYASTFERDLALSLDTCYSNDGRRDMHIYGNIIIDLKNDNDAAYLQLQTGANCGSLTTVQTIGARVFGANPSGVIEEYYYPFSFLVNDGNKYQLTSTAAGSGAVTLEANRGYFP